MTYSGQESAYDPIGKAEAEAERADYVGLHGEELNADAERLELLRKERLKLGGDYVSRMKRLIIDGQLARLTGKEDWSDVDRIQAERDEAVGRSGLPAIGNHRTISAEWMRAPLNGDDRQRRSWWPARAALDAEHAFYDAFYIIRPSLESFGSCSPSSPDGTTPCLRSVMLDEVKREFFSFGSTRIQILRITLSEGWPTHEVPCF